MKAPVITLSAISMVSAFRGMGDLLVPRVQNDPNLKRLPGDLDTLEESKLTPIGKLIKSILQGNGDPQDTRTAYTGSVPAPDSAECARDKCCIWKHIADEMKSMMVEKGGQCNSLAREAVRMGFHDAGAWSLHTGKGGGADGSLVLANECYDRVANKGMEVGCNQMRSWYEKYKSYGVSMADLIQMGANVATVVCPLGPRVRTFVGRQDNPNPAPDGLLPKETDSADFLISLFSNKTISANELVALVGAHTTSTQHFVDPGRDEAPQDSTPGIWDVKFYGETTKWFPPREILRFKSDIALSKDPRTFLTWKAFSLPILGQIGWNRAYATAYIRLSLLGVYNINELTECTKVLPPPS